VTLRHYLVAATALAVLMATTSPAKADFAAAAKAYDGGDYATAYREWRTLAQAGDTEAQIALAGLYKRAAQAGNAVAQMNLAEMYEHGLGVKRDAVAAFVWYHRAAAQGRDWAADQRDQLEKRMNAVALAAARAQLSKSQ
jgi:hypothetical protein